VGEQFSVRLSYDDGQHQYVRRFVSALEACSAFVVALGHTPVPPHTSAAEG
jgi:hypothetical protein